MRRYAFEVNALSDLVFIESSNTEGYIRFLDFIPGSVFLGVVAKEWSRRGDDVMPLLGNGIRFGDAHIMIDERPTLKMALSFYYPKLEHEPIFNYHFIKDEDRDRYTQFQQMRSGYFDTELNVDMVKLRYLQKSARENGRSKSGAMFGYRSIPGGSRFYFEIGIEESLDEHAVIDALEGVHRLGKSKSAEYALAEIKRCEPKSGFESVQTQDEVFLYAKSRLALVDGNGNYAKELHLLHPALCAENIDYERSQVRFGSYHPFNQKRSMADCERFFVEKGSVIVMKNVEKRILEEIASSGVGVHRNEGFGEVILNPDFLLKKTVELKKIQKSESDENMPRNGNELVNYLTMRRDRMQEDVAIVRDVRTFLSENGKWFSNIAPSQWGRIRAYAKKYQEHAPHFIDSYISTGMKKWREDQRRILMEYIEQKTPKHIELLATEAAKQSTAKEH